MSALILVTGGTGNLGSKVVRRLQERRCRVRVLSRKERPGEEGVEYVVGDLGKGIGLDKMLAGVDVILHCASASKGDVEATRNLVDAAKALSSPPHLIYISIVGVNTVSFVYFQDKLKDACGQLRSIAVIRHSHAVNGSLSLWPSRARFELNTSPAVFKTVCGALPRRPGCRFSFIPARSKA